MMLHISLGIMLVEHTAERNLIRWPGRRRVRAKQERPQHKRSNGYRASLIAFGKAAPRCQLGKRSRKVQFSMYLPFMGQRMSGHKAVSVSLPYELYCSQTAFNPTPLPLLPSLG